MPATPPGRGRSNSPAAPIHPLEESDVITVLHSVLLVLAIALGTGLIGAILGAGIAVGQGMFARNPDLTAKPDQTPVAPAGE